MDDNSNGPVTFKAHTRLFGLFSIFAFHFLLILLLLSLLHTQKTSSSDTGILQIQHCQLQSILSYLPCNKEIQTSQVLRPDREMLHYITNPLRHLNTCVLNSTKLRCHN